MPEEKNYCYKYPRAALTTDCVVFTVEEKDRRDHEGKRMSLNVLLVKRKNPPFEGQWAFPGGFMRMNETVEGCAIRELKEETNISIEEWQLRQLGVFSEPDRDPRERVVTIAFYALMKMVDDESGVALKALGGDDAADARFFDISEVKEMHLAFDHDKIFEKALSTLRERIHFEPVGFMLLKDKFTLSQLQDIYEIILEAGLDKRNFIRKMQSLKIINPLEEKLKGTDYKAPRLYEFNKKEYDNKLNEIIHSVKL